MSVCVRWSSATQWVQALCVSPGLKELKSVASARVHATDDSNTLAIVTNFHVQRLGKVE
jgi:hypothetical protein